MQHSLAMRLRFEQRLTMAMHWIGAGANIFEGGDLAQMDNLGEQLLYDPRIYATGGVVERFNMHPMQPRNPKPAVGCPSHWPWRAGGGNPQQLQAWIAGPNTVGDALVILSNLGPDEHPRTGPGKTGTFMTQCMGTLRLQISFRELGLEVGNSSYHVSIVWDGRRQRRQAITAQPLDSEALVQELGPWESIMYTLSKV